MTVTTALDPTFGQRGLVYGQFSGLQVELSQPSAVAVQPDGKVVQVGTSKFGSIATTGPSFLLVSRLNADGTPDTTFGTLGTFTVPTPTTTTVTTAGPREVTILADGSILFLGTYLDGTYNAPTPYRTAVIKVTPGGALDTSFGTGGEVLVPTTAGTIFGDLVVQADGRLLYASQRSTSTADLNRTYSLTLTRFSAAGVLDTSFGTDGTLAITPPQSAAPGAISDATFQNASTLPNGQILLVGNTFTWPSRQEPLVNGAIMARVDADGTLDPSFGAGGLATFQIGSDRINIAASAVQPDGKVLLFGQDDSLLGSKQFLVRILTTGSVDPAFTPSNLEDRIDQVAVAADGSITLVGPLALSDGNVTLVQRLRPDGSPDATFGTRGRATYRLDNSTTPATGPLSNYAAGVALTPGGVVVVATVTTNFSYGTVRPSLARLLPVVTVPTPGDYDGDGRSDPALLLPDLSFAYRAAAGDSIFPIAVGVAPQRGLPAAGDYDGDGMADPAIYLAGEGLLRWFNSSSGSYDIRRFGSAGDGQSIPAPGDYDGDGRTDVAVYLPAAGALAVVPSGGTPAYLLPFGSAGVGASVPAPGDYDGDGKTDVAVYLPALGALAVVPSGGTPAYLESFGSAGAGSSIPAPGDYDGDGKADVAVYLPAAGAFAIKPSGGAPAYLAQFGGPGAGASIPAPGDYDGDGRSDLAVYFPGAGLFAYRPSNGGSDVLQLFGPAGDGASVPAASIPYAQPPTVSARSLALPASATPDIAVPLTQEVLDALAGKAKGKPKA